MSKLPSCMIGPSEPCEAFQALQAEVERLRAESERLRRERNLAVEMLQSAERELAAERAARVAVASPVREEGEL